MDLHPGQRLKATPSPTAPAGASEYAGAAASSGRVPERGDIDDGHKWNLADLYPDATAWEADFAQAGDAVVFGVGG